MKKYYKEYNVGDILKYTREKNGFSFMVMSKELGIPKSSYYDYESNRIDTPLTLLIDLSLKFGIDFNDLIDSIKNNTSLKIKNKPLKNSNIESIMGSSINTSNYYEHFARNLSKNFKSLRKKSGKSIYDLAEYLELSPSTYSRYESNFLNISLSIFIKLCEYYKITDYNKIVFGRLY